MLIVQTLVLGVRGSQTVIVEVVLVRLEDFQQGSLKLTASSILVG